jgi:hypothetical protein
MAVRTLPDYEGGMTDETRPDRPSCERCGKPALTYVAAVPKSPDHPQDQHVFHCSACAHVQWIAVPPRAR